MNNLTEELWKIGLSGLPANQPMLSEEDVDNYAEEYAQLLRKAQAQLGYRPFDVETGETF